MEDHSGESQEILVFVQGPVTPDFFPDKLKWLHKFPTWDFLEKSCRVIKSSLQECKFPQISALAFCAHLADLSKPSTSNAANWNISLPCVSFLHSCIPGSHLLTRAVHELTGASRDKIQLLSFPELNDRRGGSPSVTQWSGYNWVWITAREIAWLA